MKEKILLFCFGWFLYFEAPGPRQIYDMVTGNSFQNPQYLFADSKEEVCRRVRRVVHNGEVKIYIENLSSHTLHIELPAYDLRKLISLCSWEHS